MSRAPSLAWAAERWRGLSAFAGVVVSLVTAAIHPPPVGEPAAHVAFGGFAAAVVSGLVYVFMRRHSAGRYAWTWWGVALAAVSLCVVVNLTYASMWDRYVTTYAGARHVVGSELTEVGRRWVETRGQSAPADLLFAAAGQTDMMWTPASIAATRQRFRLVYYSCYPLFALSVLATVQAVQAAGARRLKRSRPPAHHRVAAR